MPRGFRKSDGKSLGFPLGSMKPELNSTKNPTINDIYWAAGIYEGEGSCANTGRSEFASVDQKDPYLLYIMRDFFGGRIYKYPNQICHRWAIFGARARGFMQTIYILLSPRRQKQIRKVMKIGEYNDAR